MSLTFHQSARHAAELLGRWRRLPARANAAAFDPLPSKRASFVEGTLALRAQNPRSVGWRVSQASRELNNFFLQRQALHRDNSLSLRIGRS